MRVAVIGAGVVGVSTAYFLAQNGHQVSVIEQHGNVCEQASLGHAGLFGPAHLLPLGAPGMPRQVIAHWFKSDSALRITPSLNISHWRWLRSWIQECALERMLANKEKMLRLGKYSQQLFSDISLTHNLEFQQRSGILQLFRTAKEQANIEAGLALLSQADLPFQILDEAACRLVEPALNMHTPIAGGIFFPNDSQGNSVLFAKHIKMIAQQNGVEFAFLTRCDQLVPTHNGVTLHMQSQGQSQDQDQNQARTEHFDAAVLTAGAQSATFFNALRIPLRTASIRSFSNTSNIKNMEDSPRVSIIDDSRQITITRMDKRIRVAGTLHSGNPGPATEQRAQQLLRDTGADWFPDAANYSTGSNWSGRHLMLPDNAPLLGQSPEKNIYLNVAHAEYGWSMALGSAKVVADIVSGKTPEINLDGLNMLR